MLRLRAHHLLCIERFQGKGYNSEFTESMAQLIQELQKNSMQMIELLNEGDMLCENCPNCINENKCKLGNNNVVQKNNLVLQYLKRKPKSHISYIQLQRMVQQSISEDDFNACCSNCRWYTTGVCAYKL